MSDKPTTVADWTPSGADVVTPSAGEKSSGFQGSERPPAQYINWFWELVTQWIIWINNGYLTRASLSDNTPVQAQTDQDANVKSWVDSSGYEFGAVIEENYWWRAADTYTAGELVSLGAPFYVTTENTGYAVSTVLPPSSVIGTNMLQINSPSGPTVGNGVIVSCDDGSTGGEYFGNLDDASAVFECTFRAEQLASSSSDVFIGFYDPQGNPANILSGGNHGVGFFIGQGSGVLYGCTADGTSFSTVTTGQTLSVNTLYHLRVEHHGANTPQGVSAGGSVARFFLDGVLVLTKTTTPVLDTAYIGPCFITAGAVGGGTAHNKQLGPIRWGVNYMVSSQVPA